MLTGRNIGDFSGMHLGKEGVLVYMMIMLQEIQDDLSVHLAKLSWRRCRGRNQSIAGGQEVLEGCNFLKRLIKFKMQSPRSM